MCDDCCICLSIGCPTKINPSGGDGQARICPRCNNGSVFQAQSQQWLEICFLPLFPFKSKEVWSCNICS
ncbi:hypothetical protein VP01_81g11 [Puccinia sorghi]|uniref:Zinc-ribbon 15 domain-containing protein n=1 Tax=Puccinia sorghi TaxID=27349 RepID=A0A0L6UA07_9BASI|nr:hypothetical protein VP01_81g11 [Puccinia sorghi]